MKFLSDSFVVCRRQLRMNLRNPAWMVIGLLQPVLYLLLFAPLLEPISRSFGYDNAYSFLVPGLMVQLGTFGALFAGFSLLAEKREGVIEAERVTPASRGALLAGRMSRDLLQLLVQVLILMSMGYVLGMRAPLAGVALGIVLTLLTGAACAAASNGLAMTARREDLMAPIINTVMMPVLLLSGILLPMTLGTPWLQRMSDFMPIKHIVDAVRGSFVGDASGSTVAAGIAWAVGLCVVASWWGTAAFRRDAV